MPLDIKAASIAIDGLLWKNAGGIMGRWRVVTEKYRNDCTGKWEVKFFAVSPDGKMFPCASHAEAQQRCRTQESFAASA